MYAFRCTHSEWVSAQRYIINRNCPWSKGMIVGALHLPSQTQKYYAKGVDMLVVSSKRSLAGIFKESLGSRRGVAHPAELRWLFDEEGLLMRGNVIGRISSSFGHSQGRVIGDGRQDTHCPRSCPRGEHRSGPAKYIQYPFC